MWSVITDTKTTCTIRFLLVWSPSDPKIVVVVVINEPRGDEHYGGQVAAPVFSQIAAGAMRLKYFSRPDTYAKSFE